MKIMVEISQKDANDILKIFRQAGYQIKDKEQTVKKAIRDYVKYSVASGETDSAIDTDLFENEEIDEYLKKGYIRMR